MNSGRFVRSSVRLVITNFFGLLGFYDIVNGLYVVIISHTRFRMNLHSVIASASRSSLLDVWSWSDCNGIRTHNHLVYKQTLIHLVSLAKWLSVRLRTKWLWVQIPLQLFMELEVYKNLIVMELDFFRKTFYVY